MKRIYSIFVALTVFVAACGDSDPMNDDDESETDESSEALTGYGPHRHVRIAQVVEREDIVSNKPGAKALDTDLRNAWGLAFSSRGTAWVSAAETGVSPVYNDDGGHVIPTVTIPTPMNGTPPSHPTGQVFNPDNTVFKGDAFVFVTEDGTISGWQGGTAAVLRVDNSKKDAIYKGVTIAKDRGKTHLYATNFHAGRVEVYDDAYNRVPLPWWAFRDPKLPHGYAPFNVENVQGVLVVTYAKQDADKEDDVAGRGNGFVDLYDPAGHLISRLISRGGLNSPWGIALAPPTFGKLGGRLLIGNFGDGKINVYRIEPRHWGVRAVHEGVLGDDKGAPIVIDGLWALKFGVDAGGFSSDDLYFTAGPNDEEDGVFGELDIVK